jgi:hypothetical protein
MVHKAGGVAIPHITLMAATQLASKYAIILHNQLQSALQNLENDVMILRMQRIDKLRAQKLMRTEENMNFDDNDALALAESIDNRRPIDKDDPILAFNNIHQPALLRREEKL